MGFFTQAVNSFGSMVPFSGPTATPVFGNLGYSSTKESFDTASLQRTIEEHGLDTSRYDSGPYEESGYSSENTESVDCMIDRLIDQQRSFHQEMMDLPVADDYSFDISTNTAGIHEELRVLGAGAIAFFEKVMKDNDAGLAHLRYACDAIDSVYHSVEKMDESAERRHHELLELLSEIRRPRANSAEEKYRQAVVQYETGHFDSCLIDLNSMLADDSTHVPGWILFGKLCFRNGQTKEAKAAYRRAADYAEHLKNTEGYVVAMMSLSQLERMVGNFTSAYTVMTEACTKVDASSELAPIVAYEKAKAFWAMKEHRNAKDALTVALELKGLFSKIPGLRNEVAVLPLFSELREFHPWLKVGDAPYAELNDAVELIQGLDAIGTELRKGFEEMEENSYGTYKILEVWEALLCLIAETRKALIKTDFGRCEPLEKWDRAILEQVNGPISELIGLGACIKDKMYRPARYVALPLSLHREKLIFASLQMLLYGYHMANPDRDVLTQDEFEEAKRVGKGILKKDILSGSFVDCFDVHFKDRVAGSLLLREFSRTRLRLGLQKLADEAAVKAKRDEGERLAKAERRKAREAERRKELDAEMVLRGARKEAERLEKKRRYTEKVERQKELDAEEARRKTTVTIEEKARLKQDMKITISSSFWENLRKFWEKLKKFFS